MLCDPRSPPTFLSPELAESDINTRYVVALYWATITVTTMGYGDITPATHEVVDNFSPFADPLNGGLVTQEAGRLCTVAGD